MLLFVPVVFALPYMVYRIAVDGPPPTAEALQSDKILIFLSVVGILPAHLLTLVIAWLAVTSSGRFSFKEAIGFEWPQNISPTITVGVSVLLALVLLAVAWLATSLYGGGETQLDALIKNSLATRFATAFVALVSAPLVEEVVYRGVVYPAIEKAAGVGVAITIVSLLFAGVHVFQYMNNISVIIVITVLSITLTVARALTHKVLPSFIIHLVFNGIQSIVLVLAPFVEKPPVPGFLLF